MFIACFSLMVAICVVFICCSNTKSLTTALSSVMAATMASWSHRIQFSPQGQLRNLVDFVLERKSVCLTRTSRKSLKFFFFYQTSSKALTRFAALVVILPRTSFLQERGTWLYLTPKGSIYIALKRGHDYGYDHHRQIHCHGTQNSYL